MRVRRFVVDQMGKSAPAPGTARGFPHDGGGRVQVFSARVEHIEGAAVVWLAGELDRAASRQLDELTTTLVSHGHSRIVLDLAELTFVDAAGLATMLHAKHRARAANGWLVVRAATPGVRRLLVTTGLSSELHLEDRDGRPVITAAREAAWT